MRFKEPRVVGRWVFACLFFGLYVSSPVIGSEGNQDQSGVSQYTVDNAHTSIVFAVSHYGMSYTYGRFNKCEGTFSLVGGELAKQGFTFVIDATSVDTNHAERDKQLRGSDFFDVQQFPTIKFVTKKIEKVDGIYQVTGDITLLGTTRTITAPFRLVGIGKGPAGKQRAGFFAKFSIKRSEFGMNKMSGQIGDNIAVTLSFEGIRQYPISERDTDR